MTAPIVDGARPVGRPDAPSGPRRWRMVIFAVIAIALGWSIFGTPGPIEWALPDVLRSDGLGIEADQIVRIEVDEIGPQATPPFVDGVHFDALNDAWNIVRLMWPPDFATEFDRGVIGKVLESVYIAWIGTIIAATISLPLSFLAAGNVSPRIVRLPVRQLFNAIRAVPELIVAVILIGVTGLGPWAGALAIGLHSIGTLGKLSSEEIESIDPGPIEAVEAAGGRWISSMRWAVIPQALPIIVSYWLFRFEINVRASAVLGMIGAGGVGAELVAQLNFRNFPEVGAVLAVTVAVVLVIDTISSAVRRRIIRGSSGAGDEPDRNAEALGDLAGRWT